MNRNTIIIGAALLIIGIGLGYVMWGNSSTTPAGNHMMSDGSTMGQDIDQHFIVQMIPHHDGAIAMSKIALERSKRPEIISLSKSIIESQQKEIDDMKSWYQSWYGSEVPQSGMGMMRPSDERRPSAEQGSTEANGLNVGSTEASRPNVH